MPRRTRATAVRLSLTGALVATGLALLLPGGSSTATDEPPVRPTPQARCNDGSRPETSIQGRVPSRDYESGRAARGYTCNTRQVSHFGVNGGFKVFRYVDDAGHVCAIYDSTLLFPTGVPYTLGSKDGTGVVVLDMTDPANPVKTANLVTGAMESPHESLYLNQRRGLLAAVWGNAATAPGVLDIYDVKQDCRNPVLKSTSPMAGLGHESGFAPDGKTFYASSSGGQTLTASDVTNPSAPTPLTQLQGVNYHGLRLSPDGNTMYVAEIGNPEGPTGTLGNGGLKILDVSEVQARESNPQIRTVSDLRWRQASIPQAADPVVIDGRRYVVEADEFANSKLTSFADQGYEPDAPVGAGRIIDVTDPKDPFVVSNLRLAVHQLDHRDGPQRNDPGASSPLQGYAAHYCSVPRLRNPGIVACSMIASGLRIFDVSDPRNPREVGYFNQPVVPGETPQREGAYAMSAPAYDLKNRMVWYTDGNSGFYAVRLAKSIVPRHYWD